MNNSILKKITIGLIAVVVILILASVIVNKYITKDEQPKNRESLSGIEIDAKFKTALKNYGFSDEWITRKKLKKISGDSLFVTYSIKVPKDVPIQMLLLEMKEIFWEDEVEISAEEIETNKKSLVQLTSEKKLKLAAELFYDEEIKREFGTASFLVSDLPFDDDEQLSELLKTPEHYYVVLVPSANSKNKINDLQNSEKRYVILLNDDITELDYKLASNFSEDRILRSLREIISTFSSAVFFMIDEKSDLYESKNYSFIQTQLNKRGIVFVPTNRFATLNSSGSNADVKFQNFMQSLSKQEEKILLVTSEEYLNLVKLIPSYRKIGYKFINPGEIILRKTESN